MSRQAVFVDIWERNAWNGTVTRAGPGSTYRATAKLVEWLPGVLRILGARSILDAGCSESLWVPDLPGYVGVDIVPQAIEVAREHHPGRDFRILDICADPLPRVDAVMCRDALQHLSYADGFLALANFRRTGARWLLANTHRGGRNEDIRSGEWYEIDLEARPFSLGTPLHEIADGTWDGGVRYPTKRFGVWEL